MEHSVRHGLGRDRAKKVAEQALDSYAQRYAQYEPKATWISDHRAHIQFSVKGLTLKGSLDVRDVDIVMNLDVPFVMRPFKGKAIATIERIIQEWVQKARAGEI